MASGAILDRRRKEHRVVNKPSKKTPIRAILRRFRICNVQSNGMGKRKITISYTIVTIARPVNVGTFARQDPTVAGIHDFWTLNVVRIRCRLDHLGDVLTGLHWKINTNVHATWPAMQVIMTAQTIIR